MRTGGVKAAKKFPRSHLGPTEMGMMRMRMRMALLVMMGMWMVLEVLGMTATSCLMAV